MCELILRKKCKVRGSMRLAIDYTGKLPWREAECVEIENLTTNAVARHIAKHAGVVIRRYPIGLHHGMFHTPVRSCPGLRAGGI